SYDSFVFDINDHGDVVGVSGVAPTNSGYAVLYKNNVPQNLGSLGGVLEGDYNATSMATAVNNADAVAGYSYTANNFVHAFADANGTMTDIGILLGSNYSRAVGISDAGAVIGFVYDGNGGTGPSFEYLNGVATFLTGPSFSNATAINNSGLITGRA